jgi:hypothetical protein
MHSHATLPFVAPPFVHRLLNTCLVFGYDKITNTLHNRVSSFCCASFCSQVVEHASVSRQHLVLTFDVASSGVLLTDLQSGGCLVLKINGKGEGADTLTITRLV